MLFRSDPVEAGAHLLGLSGPSAAEMVNAYLPARRTRGLHTLDDLRRVILEGAAMRIRPKVMTVLTMMIGLLPIFWSTGPGSDLMKRIAAPMAGGIMSSFLMELLVYPVLYFIWRRRAILAEADYCEPSADFPSSFPSQFLAKDQQLATVRGEQPSCCAISSPVSPSNTLSSTTVRSLGSIAAKRDSVSSTNRRLSASE